MKAWVQFFVPLLAMLTLGFGILLMPAAELLPAQLQHGPMKPGLSPIRSYEMMQGFKQIGDWLVAVTDQGPNIQLTLAKEITDNISGEARSYATYAVCLAGAMILAAVAINLVGRWDSEEKTTIPIKK